MKSLGYPILGILALSLVFGAGSLTNAYAAIQINGGVANVNPTANQLVNSILGPGISVVGAPTISGIPGGPPCNPSGLFSNGLDVSLGISDGIVLSSGDVDNWDSTNNADNTSCGTGGTPDTDLAALVGGTQFDGTTLTFQFQFDNACPVGGCQLFFDYVFSSEEYNEYVNSQFNDGFALFLQKDNVGAFSNIATVPAPGDNSGVPVTINNVNCDNPFDSGNLGTNCNVYNNNDLQDGGPVYNIELDGFTDVFQASASGLSQGPHTMKFAIADTADGGWDSAVFVKAGSFSNVPDAGEIIGGEIIPIETTSLLLAGAQSFSWMIPAVLAGIGIGVFIFSRR
jgi:hypothetical protein